MIKYTVVIIDDEKNAAESLKFMILKTGLFNVIGVFTESQKAILEVPKLKPDIVFLDVQMPELDGIEIAQFLQKILPCRFIFTTGFKEYAFESFQFNTIDYLLKPIVYTRLLQAASKAIASINGTVNEDPIVALNNSSFITIPIYGTAEPIKVMVKDIEFISSDKNYCSIWLNSKDHIKSRITLKAIEKILPQKMFVRIHRAYLANVSAINHHDSSNVVLKFSKKVLPISRSNLRCIRNAFRSITN